MSGYLACQSRCSGVTITKCCTKISGDWSTNETLGIITGKRWKGVIVSSQREINYTLSYCIIIVNLYMSLICNKIYVWKQGLLICYSFVNEVQFYLVLFFWRCKTFHTLSTDTVAEHKLRRQLQHNFFLLWYQLSEVVILNIKPVYRWYFEN